MSLFCKIWSLRPVSEHTLMGDCNSLEDPIGHELSVYSGALIAHPIEAR